MPEPASISPQELIIHISSQRGIQWCHVGSLKLSMMGVLTPWKLAKATHQALFMGGGGKGVDDQVVKHLPARHWWRKIRIVIPDFKYEENKLRKSN